MATPGGRVYPLYTPPSFTFPNPERKSDTGSDDMDRDTYPLHPLVNPLSFTFPNHERKSDTGSDDMDRDTSPLHPLGNPPSFAFPNRERKSYTGSDDMDRDTSPFLSRELMVPNETYVIQIPKEQILRQPPPDHAHRAKVYARRPVRRRVMRRCCCSVITFLILLVIAVGAAAGILYLIVRPKAPSYSLTSVNITGLDPVLTSASVALSPIVEVTVEANNNNKRLSILYQSGGTVELYFQDTKLCSGDWPKFRQGPKNITDIQLQMTRSDFLMTASTRNALVNDQKNKSVSLTMHANVPVKVKYSFITSWKITAKVKCDITVDGITGEMAVSKKDCSAKSHYFW